MTTEHDELQSRFEQLPTDELVSILRRHDGEEWRPEVFDVVKAILVGRGIFSVQPAASGDEAADANSSRRSLLPPGEDSAEIEAVFDLGEADDADKQLTAAGIRVQVAQIQGHDFSIYVPKAQVARATEVLRSAGLLPSRALSEPITTTGGSCPACGAVVEAGAAECPVCGLAV